VKDEAVVIQLYDLRILEQPIEYCFVGVRELGNGCRQPALHTRLVITATNHCEHL